MTSKQSTNFNWKIIFYGIIGFALGGGIFTALAMGFEPIDGELDNFSIYNPFAGIIGLILWGMLGSVSLGIGLFGSKNKRKILHFAYAGIMGTSLGIAAMLFLIIVLSDLGDFGFIIGFCAFIVIMGAAIGQVLNNKRVTVYLIFLSIIPGLFLSINYTAGFGGMVGLIHTISSSIIIGFSYALIIAYFTRKQEIEFREKFRENKKINKWVLFAIIAVATGLLGALLINIVFPPESIEDFGCCGKIITTKEFLMNTGKTESIGIYTIKFLEYTRDGKTIRADEHHYRYDHQVEDITQDMRLSLEWIRQNVEDDAVFFNACDRRHLIRAYTGHDSVICEFSPGEIDYDEIALYSTPEDTLTIMEKYNANYFYIHWSDLRECHSYHYDTAGNQIEDNLPRSRETIITPEEKEEINKKAKDSEEWSMLMNELRTKKRLKMFENTTLEKALNEKEIEGLKLVYSDKFAVIYKRI